ncbi:protein of unknown function [Burkholderia multivorans]
MWLWAGGRRGARDRSGRRHGVVYRLDPRGQARVGTGRRERQAGRAGARRQVRVGDPRRRGSRHGGQGHGQRVLPERGPDLFRAYPDAGARVALRRSARAREGRRRSIRCRRSAAGGDAARRARVLCAAAARAGVHPARHRRRCGTRHGRRRPAGQHREGLLREADGVRPRRSEIGDRAGGNLRAGAVDHHVSRRGRGGPHRQRFAVRTRRRGVGGQRRAGVARRTPHPHRAGRHQRRNLEHGCAVRRLQAVGARPRKRRLRARGVSRIQVDAAESVEAGLSGARHDSGAACEHMPFFC